MDSTGFEPVPTRGLCPSIPAEPHGPENNYTKKNGLDGI